MGKLYEGLAAVFRRFEKKMDTVWNTEKPDRPCIFVCNHAGAMGPIKMCTAFPLHDEVRIWCNEGIMNRKTCVAYVRQDHWWDPESRLAGLYNATLPYIASWILPPVLKSAPTIPVYHDSRTVTMLRQSLNAMKEGNHLVIFPEQPSAHGEHHTWINTGWLQLLPIAAKRLGQVPAIYPVNVDLEKHRFTISPPVFFDPDRPLAEQTDGIAEALKPGLWLNEQ